MSKKVNKHPEQRKQTGPRLTSAGLELPDGDQAKTLARDQAFKDNEEQLLDTDRQPDDYSVRAKSQGHGKKTADKWNQ